MKILSTTSLNKELQVKSSSGYLKKLNIAIDSTASTGTYYIQLHNVASTPADTTATTSDMPRPIKVVHVTGGNDSEIDFDFTDPSYSNGLMFNVGLYVCISSTQFTKTLVGSNVASITAAVL